MVSSEYDLLFKVLLLGDSGVGKSCLILRYTENQFNQNLMNSIGVDFKLKSMEVDNKNIKLQIWDTAGQERFRTITTSYYRGAQAIIIVYDITDKDSFYHVKNWMADIDKFAKDNVLRFLVGNKCDLDNKRAVTTEQGRDLGTLNNEIAKQYNIQFFETSAKDTINIDNLFISTTKTFLERQATFKDNKKGKVVTKTGEAISEEENRSVKKGCC